MAHDPIHLRAMRPGDWDEVARLIHDSLNRWYQANRNLTLVTSGPASCRLFCEVYESLDPGCCVVAQDRPGGAIIGACFFHPRPTHVSLGIMAVHPDSFGRGVARRLLAFVIDIADRAGKPLRLVSSAMNLDSFSLYTRAGFVPRAAFQDMLLNVPEAGLDLPQAAPRVRDAQHEDVPAMADLEESASGIRREKDLHFFIDNALGIWHLSVLEGRAGRIDGFLASVNHPGSNMLGPGVMRSEADALALIVAELNHHRGRRPVFLVPVECADLVRSLYAMGARNCEIHFTQARGEALPTRGVVMPTFMPETG